MALPDRTLYWVEGPPWDRTCTPVEGEGGIEVLLRDLDALRAGLARLDNVELGRVFALVLRQVNGLGDLPLPNLLRVLADQVDELLTDMEDSTQARARAGDYDEGQYR